MTKRKTKQNKRKENKRAKEEKKNTYIYIYICKLLFMIRGMLSAYSKRKRYLLHFEFQN